VIAQGTPEDVAANADSYTGVFLAAPLGLPAPTSKRRKVSA
jgi:excinuclease ABC subunit A